MKHIETAISQLDKCEIPKGSNWGPDVSGYLKSVGIGFPAAWCMAFVYWCVKTSGLPNPLIRTGGVLHQWNLIDKKLKFTEPKAGDIFIQDHGQGLGHTGFVEKVEKDCIHTIEGNTNNDGSRNGYAVERKIRKIKDPMIKGYIRICP
jgi:hypothetical protein